MSYSSSFVHDYVRRLEQASYAGSRLHSGEIPCYDVRDTADRDLLVSASTPESFVLGTGASIFTDAILPAIASAASEVIFVTCFWAPSKTLSAFHDALAKLAAHRSALIRDAAARGAPPIAPLRVRICLSSRSVLQKLLHPQSRNGYIYPPSAWQKQLGLPGPALLSAAGIVLSVKSIFFLPFSVMHPKFVIIDRERAFIPSCNVSWESWLEGCVQVTGGAVLGLLSFYARTWEKDLDFRTPLEGQPSSSQRLDARETGLLAISSAAHYRVTIPPKAAALPTLVLPSTHHRNPRFRPLPWQASPEVPATPLNVAILELFDRAERSIYVQTPNLTCEPVVAALLEALKRGVDVAIVTSCNMMLLEQLLTAGTTTSRCIRLFISRFRQLKGDSLQDLEAGRPRIGRLRISYFQARPTSKSTGHEGRPLMASQSEEEEPVHTHLKLTIVDDEYTVLGSGNMDRASWYTSQELGVLFHDGGFAAAVKAGVDTVLDGRLKSVIDSTRDRG
ncbi:hypothetical protein B0T26DRAFT_739008 [Lasiosphaeria miniovina]|uniref:PLD phosphodiesterase domain-containing protein n=1 Tax=Lasiosphaeria miniovina TaxID=1954250 RepID=A0AA40B6V1_9PEZI|nr:uncharacterized protein B0T26DRAFT_739008 [Lasiosphaeria miniovina]KAK0728759.1 hypothetical protein B0T26DRAFT_739008 [Lasiosphaeria miniovina]